MYDPDSTGYSPHDPDSIYQDSMYQMLVSPVTRIGIVNSPFSDVVYIRARDIQGTQTVEVIRIKEEMRYEDN